jgi:adenine C2-methylase RlmN of 23S rRNA A2503 and tRNA A37
MKSTYSTSSYISLQQSLNLYLDGKKGQILEKNFSSINLTKIIKECSEQKSSDNEIMNLCDKFRTTLNNGLSFLYSYLSNIAEKIEEISQLFNIHNLLNKYEITLPLNPKKEFDMIRSYDNKECPEEIYYLTLVFSYFFIISNIL